MRDALKWALSQHSLLVVTTLVAIIARPSWEVVTALALLSVRHGFDNLLAHQERQKQAAETDRLARLELEVRSLTQAITIKNLGRG